MDIETKNNLVGVLYLVKRASPEGFLFRIKLQKMALLAKLEFDFPFSFNYESHYYGPYSESLQIIVSACVKKGYIDENIIEFPNESYGFSYSLTQEGEKILEKIISDRNDIKKLDELWEKYKDQSTASLVARAKEVSGIKSRNE